MASSRLRARVALPSILDEEWDELDTGVTPPQTLEQIAIAPAAQLRQVAAVTLLTGLNAGQVFTLEHEETVLGRGKRARVRIDEAGISREHARIVQLGDSEFWVEDMGSRNGTFVNGERITQAELRPGDRVNLGPTLSLRFSVVDETEEKLARQLYEASTRDALTRIYNRRYFNERLAAEVAFAHRHGTELGVVMFDIDHFKRINDQFGHPAGDDVLREVTASVTRLVRAEDVLARYGGEEFVALARGISAPHMVVLGERIRAAVEGLGIAIVGGLVKVTISAGVAMLSECGAHATGDVMVLLADERLYRAKAEGRNRVSFE